MFDAYNVIHFITFIVTSVRQLKKSDNGFPFVPIFPIATPNNRL